MTMTGKERATLRAECNRLKALVHLGHQGLTEAHRKDLDGVLRTHELVKVQVVREAGVSARDAAAALAEAMGAEVIQVIGRAVTLYRHNPDLKRKPGAPPPWRDA